MRSKGRQLHAKAEVARETGKFLEALISADQAIIAYQKAADYLGLAEVLASRQSTFKHLYEKTEDKAYLILEKHAAEAAVEIAKLSKLKEALAIPYHNLGKYYQESNEDKKAVQSFKKAVKYLEKFPPKMHNRPAVLLDIKGHLYAAKYRAGDKSAFKKAAAILKLLEQADEPSSYNKNVWLSGAHLRIAEMIKADHPQKAKQHFLAAKKIIEADPRLKLRRFQLKKLQQIARIF